MLFPVILALPTWSLLTLTWLLYALLGLVALAVLWMAFHVLRTIFLNWFGAQVRVRAKMLRKWTRNYERPAPEDLALTGGNPWGIVLDAVIGEDGDDFGTRSSVVCWAAFEVGRGEVELAVPEDDYINLEEGAEGLLTYRNERFVEFRVEGQ
jgi:hypothetical protein